MNPTLLGSIVKRVYPDFDMTNFSDRLKLQKIIYLIQESGIGLGYNFRLYLHGPYSTRLAKDGFNMPQMQECSKLKFESADAENILVTLISTLGRTKDEQDSMEIIASLHLFHKLFPEKSDVELIQAVKDKSPRLNKQEALIKDLLNKLKRFNFIKW